MLRYRGGNLTHKENEHLSIHTATLSFKTQRTVLQVVLIWFINVGVSHYNSLWGMIHSVLIMTFQITAMMKSHVAHKLFRHELFSLSECDVKGQRKLSSHCSVGSVSPLAEAESHGR